MILKLKTKPYGYNSRHYHFTIGKDYVVHDVLGCCVCVDDDTGNRVSINRDHFE